MKLTTLVLSLTAAGALAIGSTAFARDTCGCKSKKASCARRPSRPLQPKKCPLPPLP